MRMCLRTFRPVFENVQIYRTYPYGMLSEDYCKIEIRCGFLYGPTAQFETWPTLFIKD